MPDFIIDRYALGLQPNWLDILLGLIDLELGLTDEPRPRFILNYILRGYSEAEAAVAMGMRYGDVQNVIRKIRRRRNRS
jgi:hypothetical protein